MAPSSSSSPSSFVKSDEVEEKIERMLNNCLSATSLDTGIKREVSAQPSTPARESSPRPLDANKPK